MQPYFIPYAGYFRLFHASDLFVIYDCVQFPRRSFVHRNQVYNMQKQLEWLTLPLIKQPMHTKICELKFREFSQWPEYLLRFTSMQFLKEQQTELFTVLTDLMQNPVTYIVNVLQQICKILDIPWNVIYSSTLNIAPHIHGQDRILAIIKRLNANAYLNAPGGRALYDAALFQSHGVTLNFLADYQGKYCSIVELLQDDLGEVKRDLIAQS